MTIALIGFAVWLVVSLANNSGEVDDTIQLATLIPDNATTDDSEPPSFGDEASSFFVQVDDVVRISSFTRIIYDYYHPESGGFDTIIEHPAQFLLNMTQEELTNMFADWEVLSFSPLEVHLRQSTQVEYRLYVIGVHEGYIAVFYDDEHYSIKELTSRPVTALAAEEQQRLQQGIRVTGAEELMRALEDFSS